jgi:hypothetical protein
MSAATALELAETWGLIAYLCIGYPREQSAAWIFDKL